MHPPSLLKVLVLCLTMHYMHAQDSAAGVCSRVVNEITCERCGLFWLSRCCRGSFRTVHYCCSGYEQTLRSKRSVSSRLPRCQVSNRKLHECTESIFRADTNSFPADEIMYDRRRGSKLFVSVNERRFSTGTYPTFRNLLNSSNPRLGVADNVPARHVQAFLDALVATRPMTTLENCLLRWGLITSSQDFRRKVEQYWFHKYSRSGGALDSSGFKHVFQGELRDRGGDATGMHGWVYAYFCEVNGSFEYGRSARNCGDNLIQINEFEFYGGFKPVSSMWIGKSPELEMALYTVCFMARSRESRVKLSQGGMNKCDIKVDGGRDMTILTQSAHWVSRHTIGAAYPEC